MNELPARDSSLSDERGVAAVEFAILATLLLMIVFGIIEYGRVFNQLEVLNSAAREGARVGAVRGDSTAIRNAVLTAAQPYQNQVPDPLTVTVSGGGNACTKTTVGQDITVTWQQPVSITIVPLLPAIKPTLTIRGVFRCE